MTAAFKLLIVDDEPLAHQVLLHHLAAHADMVVAGHCYSAAEAMAMLAQHPKAAQIVAGLRRSVARAGAR